ncbi:hypothetical protein [Sulfobacillus harzensis]|uniref:Uncharacterized protein n=1 Tax=Sulfobacillus harzensis TaxID=2729629 RepID=A0A7Y0Q0V4_9FIRM|nr:hypothetical protein [Sulfobacillus harzensis]NMP20792.1 hypothetical protein [Sulfobacillus harzensis]
MYYFLYQATSGQILAANTTGFTPGTGEAVLGPLSPADPNAVIAYQYPQWFLIQGDPPALVMQPYWILEATSGTNNQYTLTATLNNPPSTPPTSATLTVLGSTYTAMVSNNTATWTIDVHPSCVHFPVAATVAATGTVSGSATFGGTQTPSVALQCVPLTGGTVPTVTPTGPGSSEFLQSFYASGISAAHQPGDIATADAIAFDTLFGTAGILAVLIKAGTWTPTSAQQAAITWIQNNINTNLPVTLAGSLDSSGNPIQPVAQYAQDLATAAQAFQSFATDMASIPGLA